MRSKIQSVPIQEPSINQLYADSVATGPAILPYERLKIFSPEQWEEFTLQFVDSFRSEYFHVERCGGAGDMGRDVIAFIKEDGSEWDNYQCKHYRDPLRPSDVWTELGKLVYYTYRKEYTYPNKYFFVSPLGAGNSLSRLLRDPCRLKQELLNNWDKYCLANITSNKKVLLDDDLKSYINGLDFSIFSSIPPIRLIEHHSKTRWHVAMFGGGLPSRPPISDPPQTPAPYEALYIRELLDAYADYLKTDIESEADILDKDLQDHFRDSRIEFYSAESLRVLSRDNLPVGSYEQLQDEIYSGIKDEVRFPHPDGYQRVLAAVRTARTLQITSHALISRMSIKDRGGICHQLANGGRVKWSARGQEQV